MKSYSILFLLVLSNPIISLILRTENGKIVSKVSSKNKSRKLFPTPTHMKFVSATFGFFLGFFLMYSFTMATSGGYAAINEMKHQSRMKSGGAAKPRPVGFFSSLTSIFKNDSYRRKLKSFVKQGTFPKKKDLRKILFLPAIKKLLSENVPQYQIDLNTKKQIRKLALKSQNPKLERKLENDDIFGFDCEGSLCVPYFKLFIVIGGLFGFTLGLVDSETNKSILAEMEKKKSGGRVLSSRNLVAKDRDLISFGETYHQPSSRTIATTNNFQESKDRKLDDLNQVLSMMKTFMTANTQKKRENALSPKNLAIQLLTSMTSNQKKSTGNFIGGILNLIGNKGLKSLFNK